jgi:WhiB family transcriptional regulator, redox-sensing transcriptional regulator
MTTANSRDPTTRAGIVRSVPAASYDRASWRESAACRQVDTELFFPIGSTGTAVAEIQRAKSVCANCPVRQPCLTFALVTNQEFGIWGGCDEDERRLMHRRWRESRTAATRESS